MAYTLQPYLSIKVSLRPKKWQLLTGGRCRCYRSFIVYKFTIRPQTDGCCRQVWSSQLRFERQSESDYEFFLIRISNCRNWTKQNDENISQLKRSESKISQNC